MKTAIILLAGTGSRLRPITNTMHKGLIPIGDKTILERQLTLLLNNNIQNIHLVLGYRASDIKTFINKNTSWQKHVSFVENAVFDKTNTAYSLGLALKNINESFLLLDGDVVMEDALLKTLCHPTAQTLFLSDTDRSKLNAEAVKFKINDQNEIIKIGKDIPLKEAYGESIGVGLYSKDWAQSLNAHLNITMQNKNNWQWYYEDAIQDLFQSNKAPSPIKIQPTNTFKWIEIDDHDDLNEAKNLFG